MHHYGISWSSTHSLFMLCFQLLRDITRFQKVMLREEGQVCTVVLASKLSSVGYNVSVRKALGSGGENCFRNLRHEFVLVRGR